MSQDDAMNNDVVFDKFNNLNGVWLPGEQIKFSGQTTDGYIVSSNYRVILKNKRILHYISLGVIETAECRDIFQLLLLCKDAKSFKCNFLSNEACLEWQRRILQSITFLGPLHEAFAFKFFSATIEEGNDLLNDHENYSEIRTNQMFDDEAKRMGYNFHAAWRITNINSEYKFCATYPPKMIVPSSICDNTLEIVAKFRMSRRIPAVLWRHSNGAVIVRSSQPEVGWLGWRSYEDECLVDAIAQACFKDSPSTSCTSSMPYPEHDLVIHSSEVNGNETDLNKNSKLDSLDTCDIPSFSGFTEANLENDAKKVLVIDARSYTTAVANRARGGGCECPEYYKCEIQFMNLANIHGVRKSQHALRHLLSLSPDIPNWLSLLENTRWMNHVSGLIKAALTVAQAIAIEARPVLVHCSDGWDRTPQITALSQLILDPFYRTFQGFEVLIEKEWIEFGHKFSDRHGCGQADEDTNERSPVFLQWLDCVHQLVNQFPTAFQFNQAYLVKLAQHLYSNLFGTFLLNSSHQRLSTQARSKTYSLWSFFHLSLNHYTNFLYLQTNEVLYPSFQLKDLELWKSVYVPEIDTESHCSRHQLSCSGEVDAGSRSPELVKTKSCDDLTALCSTSNPSMIRRSSDPNIRESCFNVTGLKTEDVFGNPATVSHAPIISSTNSFKREFQNSFDLGGNDKMASTCSEISQTKSNGNIFPKIENGIGIPLSSSNGINGKDASAYSMKSTEIIKRSIEGSTDTLVAELGTICDDLQSFNILTNESSAATTCHSEAKAVENFVSQNKSKEILNTLSAKRSFHKQHFLDPFFHSDDKMIDKKNSKTKPSISQTYCICSHHNGQVLDEVSLDCSKRIFQDAAKVVTTSEPNKLLFSNGVGKVSSYSTTGHSYNSSSCIAPCSNEERFIGSSPDHYLNNFYPVDGLSTVKDECTKRLHQILLHYQVCQESLRRDLQASKACNQQLIVKLRQVNIDAAFDEEMLLPESQGSSSAEGSVGPDSNVSDASWETVEEGDWDPTLWVPDHAVDHCMGCNSQFWIGRRKHHCRNCGKIFCAECSNNCAPIPKENLFHPVRVCGTCFMSLFDPHIYHNHTND